MFNPRRLSLARERRGYSKIELARRIGVDARSVTAHELGEFHPAPDTLFALARALEFPVEFFQGEDLERLLPEGASFRSMSKMTVSQKDMALAQGALAVHFSRWLSDRFELPPPSIPDLSHERDPEAAAETLRDEWGLGQLTIRNAIHLLEAKGVRVFSLGIEAREVDAFSLWKGNVPYVFLNSFKSSEHSRFDCAHELGHLVLHKHSSPNGRQSEREADQFASAFLMPHGSVVAETPRQITLNTVVGLKSRWIVSVAALVVRLHEVGALSDWQYRSMWKQISKRRYRTSEPHEAPRERSLILPEMLAYLYTEEGLTRADIARDLTIPLAELEQLLFGLTMTALPGGRRGSPISPGPRLTRVK